MLESHQVTQMYTGCGSHCVRHVSQIQAHKPKSLWEAAKVLPSSLHDSSVEKILIPPLPFQLYQCVPRREERLRYRVR